MGRRCSTQASRQRNLQGPRDAGQLVVERAGEGEQVVALVAQRDAHRADAPRILRLEALQFIGDEVEQRLPRGQVRTGQRQNVAAQPSGQRSNVASQPASALEFRSAVPAPNR